MTKPNVKLAADLSERVFVKRGDPAFLFLTKVDLAGLLAIAAEQGAASSLTALREIVRRRQDGDRNHGFNLAETIIEEWDQP